MTKNPDMKKLPVESLARYIEPAYEPLQAKGEKESKDAESCRDPIHRVSSFLFATLLLTPRSTLISHLFSFMLMQSHAMLIRGMLCYAPMPT